MDIRNYLTEKAALVDKRLSELIPEHNSPYCQLFQAARYSLFGSGKRIRPILALAATEALQGDLHIALSPACTLEMIHTYSLIHDDLPSMDNSDLRRGRPSLHKVHPEGQAVLAGDFLLTHAFEVLADSPGLTADQKVKLSGTLAKRAGGNGMIAGQVMDIAFEGKQINLDVLRFIHSKKTAAMFMASLEFGGIVSEASEQEMEALRHFGQSIGLAFQVVDDILDVTSTHQELGKPTGADIVNQKTTYVSLLGLETARATAQDLLQSALDSLKTLHGPTHILSGIAEMMVHREK